jgi:sensor domain CHASE-containing protein
MVYLTLIVFVLSVLTHIFLKKQLYRMQYEKVTLEEINSTFDNYNRQRITLENQILQELSIIKKKID